ncbi:receptor like protein kinase S.3 [Cryptomeria japonica]|uniref:receptor like protein kinase S.3 n=1 Tax=Cryptomeria japonica TaxID=3369 RepID=UPI0027DA409C|nr:receptor like protein kinase S.3 [Cryptomeria japonica]
MNSEGQSSSSSVISGSYGYMAPECGCDVRPSTKQDVYSFGVILLELVTGKPAIGEDNGGGPEDKGLVEWASHMRERNANIVIGLVDAELRSDYEMWSNEMEKVIDVAFLCTRASPKHRPTMQQVVDMLSPPSPLLAEYRPLLN